MLLEFEIFDIADLTDALLPPMGTYTGSSGYSIGRSRVYGMQHRRVGTIGLDQCPRERPIKWVLGVGRSNPCERRDGATGTDFDHLGQILRGDRVILRRRDEDPIVGSADADKQVFPQTGEKSPDDRSGRPGERILDDQRCSEHFVIASDLIIWHGEETRTHSSFCTAGLIHPDEDGPIPGNHHEATNVGRLCRFHRNRSNCRQPGRESMRTAMRRSVMPGRHRSGHHHSGHHHSASPRAVVTEVEEGASKRREAKRLLTTRYVMAICMVSGVAAGFVHAHPTGTPIIDVAFCVAAGFLFPLTAASSRRWVWPIVSGVALVIAGSIWGHLLGLTAFGFSLHAALRATRRDRLTGAVVGALSIQAILRSADIGFHGFTAVVCSAIFLLLAVSAYQTLRRKSKRWVGRIIVVAGLFTVLATTGLALSVLGAKSDLDVAVSKSQSGLNAALGGEQTAAASDWQQAASAFGSAENTLNNPWLKAAYAIPIIAQHARALTSTAHSGAKISTAAAIAAKVAPYRSLRSDNGTMNISLIRAMQTPVAQTEEALVNAQRSLAKVDVRWLVPMLGEPLAKYQRELDRALPEAMQANQALQVAPELLGGDGNRQYLVLFGTPSESRGLGGFIGSWAQLNADNGKLTLARHGKISILNDATPAAQRMITGQPEYLSRYGYLQPTKFIQNVSASPDFPTVANVAEQLYGQSGGDHVDGAIYVDPYALAALLELTGPISVDGIPQQLTSKNAASFLLHDQYVQFPKTDERSDLLSDVADTAFTALTHRKLPNVAKISNVLSPMVAQHRLLFTTSMANSDRFLSSIGLTGSFPKQVGTDFYSLRTSNGSGNKIDYYLHRSVTYDASFNSSTGDVDSTATITLANEAPTSGLPNYVLGNEDTLTKVPNGRPVGSNTVNFSFYTPLTASNLMVNGTETPFEAEHELGYNVYSGSVTIPSGATFQLQFKLAGQIVPATAYHLRISPQPLVNADKITTLVHGAAQGHGRPTGGRVNADGTWQRRMTLKAPTTITVPFRSN